MQKIRNRKIIQYAFVSAFLLLSTSISFCQTEGNDLIELKNGTVHQGTIIEQRPGEFLKLLQRPSNDTLLLSYSDVISLRSILGEEVTVDIPETTPLKQFNQKKYNMLLSYSISAGESTNHGFGAGVLRRFTPKIQAGFSVYGLAASIYYHTSVAVPLEFKYTLQESFDGRVSLMFSSSLGWLTYSKSNRIEEGVPTYLSNGVYFNPSFGYRINFSKNTGITFDLGYQYLGGKKRRQSNDEVIKSNHVSNVSFKASLFF